MIVKLPVLKQSIQEDHLIENETEEIFEIDTSVYSEERWEQNFPSLAQKESLFEYIERVKDTKNVSDRVRVSAMLKAVYCFIESNAASTFKQFAQLFVLSNPEYTQRLINKLISIFTTISNGSTVKN